MLHKFMQGARVFGVVTGVGALGAGCLDRPVTATAPTIKTNFTAAVDQSSISKVDILFDIDNSASMGDKQKYLIEAVPQMITRLVTPRCVDVSGNPLGPNADSTGHCPAGQGGPEFPPVHDMHIGVVTSSLGGRGGDVCTSAPNPDTISITNTGGPTISRYDDDQGHLVNRVPATLLDGGASDASLHEGATLPDGGVPPLADPGLPGAALPEGGGFLSWFPSEGNNAKAPITPPAAITIADGDGGAASLTLVQSFSELIGGAGQAGCGIESQLESWYRFLIQPDPYLTIPAGTSTWSGVDTTIIQQRHDFLRPDSLVVVMVLSDENDSEIDVRSLGGTASRFQWNTKYALPHGTSACASDPGSPDCQICPQDTGGCDTNPSPACSDPACKATPTYTSATDNDWTYNPNLRHVHMKQKYGTDEVQFPLTRYYNGLTSAKVPNRLGEYPSASSGYVGTNNCQNPLFAGTLPQASDVPDSNDATPGSIMTTLCALQGTATRTPADVFFAHIGGVPHQLLQATPGDVSCPPGTPAGMCPKTPACAAGTAPADCPQKPSLGLADWTKILGQGAATYAAAFNPQLFPGVDAGSAATVSYDYTNIDPHMIEAQTPRNAIPAPYSTPTSSPPVSSLSGPALGAGVDPVRPDPINGREFVTTGGTHSLPVDREYACIFQLPIPQQHDCAKFNTGGIDWNSCDCQPALATDGTPIKTTNTPDQVSPLCSKTSTDGTSVSSSVDDYTVQTYAKAYPTIRELTLAEMMGAQGIVSSLCPIHTVDTTSDQNDPLYGYRPAVNAIVDRLKTALSAQCVPELTADSSGDVPCLVLVSFGPTSNGPSSPTECAGYGGGAYSNVDPTILSQINDAENAEAPDAGGLGLGKQVKCQLNQIPVTTDGGTCVGDTTKSGWCYTTGTSSSSSCSQQISYSNSSVVPTGATIILQCISAQ